MATEEEKQQESEKESITTREIAAGVTAVVAGRQTIGEFISDVSESLSQDPLGTFAAVEGALVVGAAATAIAPVTIAAAAIAENSSPGSVVSALSEKVEKQVQAREANREARSEDREISVLRIITQSILMSNIDLISFKTGGFSSLRSPHLVKIKTESEPETVMNKIFYNKDVIKSYSNLTSAEISLLVPYIKIFKFYPKDNSLKEIKFNNYISEDSYKLILNNLSERGYQANLVDLSMISQGKDTATMYQYTLKLKFIFDSLESLLQYQDLFNPPLSKKGGDGNFDPNYYRLVMDFGWSLDPETKHNSVASINFKNLKSFADNSINRMYINYYIHNFTINEDASVSLEVDYIASSEAMMDNSHNANIFDRIREDNNDESIRKRKQINERREELKKQYNITKDASGAYSVKDKDTNKEISDPSIKQELQKADEDLFKIDKNDSNILMESIINRILKLYNNQLPFLTVDREKIQKVIDEISEISLSISSTGAYKQKIEDLRSISLGKTVQEATVVPGDPSNTDKLFKLEDQNIYYFKFIDLINAFNLVSNEQSNFSDNFKKILFGPVKIATFDENWNYKDVGSAGKNVVEEKSIIAITTIDGKTTPFTITKNVGQILTRVTHKTINIADIPISFELFRRWFLLNFVDKNIASMSVREFINICCKELLSEAINAKGGYQYVPKQYSIFDFDFEAVDNDNLGNFINDINIDNKDKSNKYVLTTNKLSKTNTNPNMICTIYSKSKIQTPRLAQKEKDLQEGIYHFSFGNTTGIVNKINFQKETIPSQMEASIQSAVDNAQHKSVSLIRGKYNVTIDMIGGIKFKPGTMIYVKPSFIGLRRDLKEVLSYGIGGYYMVTVNQIDIKSGEYTNKIQANWVARGDGQVTDVNNIDYIQIIDTTIKA
jgi:hypothetical protein